MQQVCERDFQYEVVPLDTHRDRIQRALEALVNTRHHTVVRIPRVLARATLREAPVILYLPVLLSYTLCVELYAYLATALFCGLSISTWVFHLFHCHLQL